MRPLYKAAATVGVESQTNDHDITLGQAALADAELHFWTGGHPSPAAQVVTGSISRPDRVEKLFWAARLVQPWPLRKWAGQVKGK